MCDLVEKYAIRTTIESLNDAEVPKKKDNSNRDKTI